MYGETQAEVVEAPRSSKRKRATNFYTTRIQVALGGGGDGEKAVVFKHGQLLASGELAKMKELLISEIHKM